MDKTEAALPLSVILVNYNDRANLARCLTSLKKNAEGISHEIIVVDNDSSDGSQEFIRKSHPDVKLICNSENTGFARANNRGIHECSGEHILLLNTDTVVKPGAIHALMDEMYSDPGIGAAGPSLLLGKDRYQVSFGRRVSFFPELLQKGLLNPFFKIWLKRALKTRRVGWLSAACLLMRSRVLKEAGLFDENFFLYFEDIDLCVRIKDLGYNLLFVPQAKVLHIGGATTVHKIYRSRFHYRKSQLYFYRKHNSRGAFFLLRSYLRINLWLLVIAGYFKGAPDLEDKRKLIELLRES